MRQALHETYAYCADAFTIHYMNDYVNHAMPEYFVEDTTRQYLLGPCDMYHSALGDSILVLTSISAGSTLQGTTVDYIATDTKLNGMEVGTTEPCAPRYIIDCLCSKIKSQNSTEATLGGEFGSNVTTTSTTCSNSGASSRMDHPNLDRNELGGTIPGNRCFKIKCQISTEAILDEVVGIVTTDCTTLSDSDESSCTDRLNFMDCNDWMSLGWADSTQSLLWGARATRFMREVYDESGNDALANDDWYKAWSIGSYFEYTCGDDELTFGMEEVATPHGNKKDLLYFVAVKLSDNHDGPDGSSNPYSTVLGTRYTADSAFANYKCMLVNFFCGESSDTKDALFDVAIYTTRTILERTKVKSTSLCLEGLSPEQLASNAQPHGKLHERQYHSACANIAAGVLRFAFVRGTNNPADTLSKHWACSSVWPLIKPILFWSEDMMDTLSQDAWIKNRRGV